MKEQNKAGATNPTQELKPSFVSSWFRKPYYFYVVMPKVNVIPLSMYTINGLGIVW